MRINRTLFILSCIVTLVITSPTSAQELSGTQLLDKAIAYHDPNGNWKSFKAKMEIVMSTPSSGDRNSIIHLNLPAQYFKSVVTTEGNTVESILEKDSCLLKLNGSSDISDTYRDSLRITCDRAKMMKDYYTYLYGLPMKLKDAGTLINPKVRKKTFKGKECLVLKATYDKQVGKDTWYFYFDPKTYSMEAYQFFHDESKNDGEYILLSNSIEVNNIKIPKTRAWYYNKDDKYLGTDNLTKAGSF